MGIASGFTACRLQGRDLLIAAAVVLCLFACTKEPQSRTRRVIQGVVTDSTTGAPVDWAWVSLHAIDTPNAPRVLVHSDSRGRYLIYNPLIGPTGVTAFCPKASKRPGVPVATSELEVHAGTDTTMDFPIAMRACNDLSDVPPPPSPRHRLSDSPPPPLMTASEVAASTASDFPSAPARSPVLIRARWASPT